MYPNRNYMYMYTYMQLPKINIYSEYMYRYIESRLTRVILQFLYKEVVFVLQIKFTNIILQSEDYEK